MRQVDVLVVGGGFGGSFAARQIGQTMRRRGQASSVVLVAAENFLTFTPLLAEAASGTIEPRHSVVALRQMLPGTEVVAGHVEQLEVTARQARIVDLNGEAHDVAWRAAVLSPGSVPMTLPVPGLLEEAVGFKTLPDAIWLRNRVLRQLEAASATDDAQQRQELLTFTFVGGGYAGVEALAELESLARDALRTYPRLSTGEMRWVLVEAASTLLPGLHSRLARYSERQLRRRGIEVHLDTRMDSCTDSLVTLSDRRVAPYRSGTIVWTTGQRPSTLLADAGLPVDDRGRVIVDAYLQVSGHAGVFAAGDAAAVPDPDPSNETGICPATAQHAMRQGKVAGTNAAAAIGAGRPVRFTYRNRGLAVTLGKHRGTAQVRRLVFTGPLAWWMGRSYHLLMLPGMARRARVVADWTLALFFPRDVSQLGDLGSPTPLGRATPAPFTPGPRLAHAYGVRPLRREPEQNGPRATKEDPVAEYEGYCVKCREKRTFQGEVKEMANGRKAAQGLCPVCGTKMNRMLGKDAK